ncbi:MAG: hypothetical protein ACMXYF_00650 [Candidatus Woesearchaeota archaeon]
MVEETIKLSESEYESLQALDAKSFLKKRYKYEFSPKHFCEIDVYQERLLGLVVIDFEFSSLQEKEAFIPPDFCLVEVTNKPFLAGGMLCGKSYEQLVEQLDSLGYKKIV